MIKDKPEYNKIVTYLFGLYCVLLPFEEALAGSFGSILRIIGISLIIVIIAAYYRNGLFMPKYNVPIVLWTLYMFFSVIWSDSFQWWSYFMRIYIVQIALLCVIEFVPVERLNIDFVKKMLMIGGFVASSIIILFPTGSGFTADGRRTVMLLGSVLDPNVVASIILLGVHVAISSFFQRQKGTRYLLITVWQMAGVLMTGSRGALIAFVIGFGVELFLNLSRKGERKKAIVLVVASVVAVMVLLAVLPENLLLMRFSKDTILGLNEFRSGAHNRYTIWLNAIQLIKKKPIFGYGCGNFFSAIATVYRQCASHNLYILLIVEGGIIGLLFFLTYVGRLIKSLFKYNDFSTISMLVTVMVMAISLDSITYKYFWISLIVARLMIRQHEYRELQEADCV